MASRPGSKQEGGRFPRMGIESCRSMATRKKSTKPSNAQKKTSFVATSPTSALNEYVSSVFPIVGVGSSAGGLEAVVELLRNIPVDPGIALVLVQHYDPKAVTALPQILSRATRMPVAMAADGDEVVPNRVYIAPSDAQLTIARGVLRLSAPAGHLTM